MTMPSRTMPLRTVATTGVSAVEPGVAPAGWYPDTAGGVWLRFWDGCRWADYDPARAGAATGRAGPGTTSMWDRAAADGAASSGGRGATATTSASAPGGAPGASTVPEATRTVRVQAPRARLVLIAVAALAGGAAVVVLGIMFTT